MKFDSIEQKKTHYAKRRKRGLVAGSIGGSILGLGFLIQYALYVNGHTFNAIMYTFTSIGIALVLYAGIEIFGW